MSDQREETDEARSYCPLAHPAHPDRPSRSSQRSVICEGHLQRLSRTLVELSTFDRDADEAAYDSKVARHDSAPLTGNGEKPLPIDPRAADLRVDARDILAAWSLRVAEERHLSPPRNQLRALSRFLTTHQPWIVSQPWIADFAGELFDLGGKAAAILRPSGRRQFTSKAMECVEVIDGTKCDGQLWALLTPDDPHYDVANELCCDQCDIRIPSSEWLAYGRRIKTAAA